MVTIVNPFDYSTIGMFTDGCFLLDKGACYPTAKLPYFGGYPAATMYNPLPHFGGYPQPFTQSRGYMVADMQYTILPSHGYVMIFQVPSLVHQFGPTCVLPNYPHAPCPAGENAYLDFI